MNICQLVLKQMRQRALSTWLTLLSVLLGVALAIAIMIVQREAGAMFGQSDYGYDAVVGAKGSRLNLVFNSVYHIGDPAALGTIPYSVYESLKSSEVKWKLPMIIGDNYEGFRVVGTTPALLGIGEDGEPLAAGRTFEYRKDRKLELSAGRAFSARKFEAVIGSEVAARTGLKLDSVFKPSHGAVATAAHDEHDESWTVVGILRPTRTALDRVIFIPLISSYAIPEHGTAMEKITEIQSTAGHDAHEAHKVPASAAASPATMHSAAVADEHAGHHHHDHEEVYDLLPDGSIDLHIPKSDWRLAAILVNTRGTLGMGFMWAINNRPEAMAVSPATEMRQFFDSFLRGSTTALLLISLLVTVVAAVSILVSIYNSVVARKREIAILRALGATRLTVLGLISLEAALIGLLGGVAGLIVGHALAAVGSAYLEQTVGQSIAWLQVDWREAGYLLLVVALAALAGLVPAMAAYRTPVATNLVAS